MVAGKKLNVFLHIIFIVSVIICIFPILLVISISLSSSESILKYGYSLIPKKWSFEAYKYIFGDYMKIVRAYGVTIFNTVVGTTLSTLIMALYSYPLSRPDFKQKKLFTFYIFFTMLFNGGTVAGYIVMTTIYHLQNKIWVMILPGIMSAWFVMVMRTFFQTNVPFSIIESGELDGANEYLIFFKLIIPISLPGIATIALFQTLYYWNDWWMPLLYVTDAKLYNLQFMLQQLMQNIQMLNENEMYRQQAGSSAMNIPSESARMALCIVAMGPILIVYPFFQKYFISGLTIGSIKG